MVHVRSRAAVLLLLGILGIGCGKGLTVNLVAVPNPADPGQSVQWNLSVRNDTACETTGEMTNFPPPFPNMAGAFALIVGFVPQLDEDGGPVEFCREFMTTMTACSDASCLAAHFEEAFGPAVANRLRAQADAAIQQAHEAQPAGTCATLEDDSNGFVAVCAFDPLSPGETDTAMHMDTAPNTGSRNSGQVAIAFAPAEGTDCRPGTEVSEGLWILAGCFPAPQTQPAPTLSPVATAMGAILLLVVGFVGLRHVRRS
jgi:hypothetical protein